MHQFILLCLSLHLQMHFIYFSDQKFFPSIRNRSVLIPVTMAKLTQEQFLSSQMSRAWLLVFPTISVRIRSCRLTLVGWGREVGDVKSFWKVIFIGRNSFHSNQVSQPLHSPTHPLTVHYTRSPTTRSRATRSICHSSLHSLYFSLCGVSAEKSIPK